MLRIPSKIYWRVAGTEHMTVEEQCGFRKGGGCLNQMFVFKNVCENKAYEKVDRCLMENAVGV